MDFLKRFWGKSEKQLLNEAELEAKVHAHRLQEIHDVSSEIVQGNQILEQSHQRTQQRLSNMEEYISRLDQAITNVQNHALKTKHSQIPSATNLSSQAAHHQSLHVATNQPQRSSRISAQAKELLASLPQPKSSNSKISNPKTSNSVEDRVDRLGDRVEATANAPESRLEVLSPTPHRKSRVSQKAIELLDSLPSPSGEVSSRFDISVSENNRLNPQTNIHPLANVQSLTFAQARAILTYHTDYNLGVSALYQHIAPKPAFEIPQFKKLEVLTLHDELTPDELFALHMNYAQRHQVDLNRPLSSLVPPDTLHELKELLEQNYTYQRPQCDAYDYMVAGTTGVLGGLIDIFMVGDPKTGILTRWSDSAVDQAICGFATLCGWDGPHGNADQMSSAIGFLERMFPVNYDQKFGAETGGIADLRPADHHLKSMAHSPDLLGLFFSILDQFTNQSHFIDNGSIVAMDTETFELHGSTLLGKLFCGTANWIGHIMSDVGGSSGSVARGSGVPIPFFNLLQLVNLGSFGSDQQTIAQISTQVFTRGYDLRHGLAMAVPVLFVELVIRLMYVLKPLFIKHPYPCPCPYNLEQSVEKVETVEDKPNSISMQFKASRAERFILDWRRGITDSPELKRMLFVGHGTLCLLDAGDAIIRGHGDIVSTLVCFNLIAWVRFAFLAFQEAKTTFLAGHIDEERLQKDLQAEYQQLLQHL